jgi:hypothetical protein
VLVWPSIMLYSIFATFAYYNRRSAREFQGSSKAVRAFLTFMGFAGIGVGLGYLVWYGISVSWMGAAAAFAVSVLCVTVGASLEQFIGTLVVQIGSVVLWPIFAVLMLWTLMTAIK